MGRPAPPVRNAGDGRSIHTEKEIRDMAKEDDVFLLIVRDLDRAETEQQISSLMSGRRED